MFDVVPPNAEEFDREEGLGRSRRRGFVRGKAKATGWRARKYGEGDLSERTVEVEWKLPSRLRKPVREQLQRERSQRQRRKSVIKFDRRPIHTQVVANSRSVESEEIGSNRGAEKHMGDTYRHSRPNVQVAVPPYQGQALARHLHKKPTGTRTDRMRRKPRMQQSQRAAAEQSLVRAHAGTRRTRSGGAWIGGERDVPFDWGGKRVAVQEQPEQARAIAKQASKKEKSKNRLSIPFSFNLWPISRTRDTGKKKLTAGARKGNVLILVVGLGLAWGVVWNLQGAGRGMAIFDDVRNTAQEAVAKLSSAQLALAEADFEGGAQSLAEAEQLLGQARSDVDEAMRAARVVLKYMDVTGRVRSGDALLTAGEELTGAGRRIVQGLQHLQGVEVVTAAELTGAEEADAGGQSLVDGIVAAQGQFAPALKQVQAAEAALAEVSPSRLPAEIGPAVEQLQAVTPRMRKVLQAVTEQSDTILYLLGAKQDREYLLAFANNHELRPVGGFVGTVGLINMDRGQVEEVDVESVYHRDGQLQDFIAPPKPLSKIVDRWFMRDTNWFVNYPASARKMAGFLEKEGGPTVDGVVLMTPTVIERLLRLSGPITMPGYEVVVTADNFRKVAQREVTYDYDPELNRPKQFLADLTPLLLSTILSTEEPGQQVRLLAALTEALSRKELLVHFRDEDAQAELAELGWDGALPPDKQGFLAVNTANIGGHKSDQFVEQEIDYRSQLRADGDVEVTVTIRRDHKGPTEELLIDYPRKENPANKDNIVYQRVLVPPEAELLEASGFTPEAEVPQRVEVDGSLPLRLDPDLATWQGNQETHSNGTIVGKEAGYRFFANWMITRPGQTTVGLYRYRVPGSSLPGWWDRAASYQTYVYKQPGDERTKVRASIEVPDGFSLTHVVPDDGITREERRVIYRGDLRKDLVTGVVIEPADN